MNKPILCYVDLPWCYFTTQSLDKQWGDDWNDIPYEHNAGEPYESNDKGEIDREISKIAIETVLETPADYLGINSPYSVEMINQKCVPWLTDRWHRTGINIFAGTPLSLFKEMIKIAGGIVYVPEKEMI